MNVVLVSTYLQPLALGLRYVSASIKRAGHQATCLFLTPKRDPNDPLPAAVLETCIELCRPADVIGLSLMTNTFDRSCELTRSLKAAGIKAPIVWGGTHPTVATQESAERADFVCVGEGEKAMVAFLDALQTGGDPTATPGFARMDGKTLACNPPMPLTDDLDDYPFPDYDLAGHWIAHKDRLLPADARLLRSTVRRYRISSTRGCPYSCSFCNNATQLRIYREAGAGRHWVRRRSAESIVTEIETMRRRFPVVEAVNFIDDLFLVRSEAEIEKFVETYTQRVNLPLEIDAFPNTVNENKIRVLSRLPIALISMGIQSGSQKTLSELYNRPTRVEKIAEAIRLISGYHLPAEYHYLVSNPFETEESLLETLRFAASHHRGPAKLRLFPLQFYPGSVMHQRAREAGFIGQRHEEGYRFVYKGKRHIEHARYLEIWLRIVLALRGAGAPSPVVHRLVDFAVHPWTRRCLDHGWLAPVVFVLYRVGHALHNNLVHKPFGRPLMLIRSWRRRHNAAAGTPGLAADA
jgi:anaerobic magnesium-protoporphyrin IX monomethyl ester cyclase